MKRFLFLMVALSSCYRMPGDDDFSTNPATNNPSITCEKQGGFVPGMNY